LILQIQRIVAQSHGECQKNYDPLKKIFGSSKKFGDGFPSINIFTSKEKRL